METVSRHQQKDISLLGRFIGIYCHGQHGGVERNGYRHPALREEVQLCSDCRDLLAYALNRRINCPLEGDKPACRHCRIHCYAGPQRAKIRKVMSYSGRRMLLTGRLDYLWHYFF